MNIRTFVAMIGAVMFGMAAVPALAVPITTANLALSQGGTNFTAFSCNITGSGFSTPNACSGVDVTTNSSGLQFQSGFNSTFGGFEDVLLMYSATNTAGINAIDLTFNGQGSVLGFMGQAIASVTETVYSNAARTNVVGQLTVTCTTAGGCDLSDPPIELGDIQLATSYTQLWITKDILLASNLLGSATISVIGQSFHTNVPEPASLAILGAGLIGLGSLRRRMQKRG